METGEIAPVWIGCDELLAPRPIPLGETRAAFPAEPTRLRVRAGSAGQCRLKAARRAGRIDGRLIGRARIGFAIGAVRSGTEVFTLPQRSNPVAIGGIADASSIM
jgi:hypothetical protein